MELGRSVARLQALAEVTQAVNSTLDLQEVLEAIVPRAVQLADARSGRSTSMTTQRARLPARGHGCFRGDGGRGRATTRPSAKEPAAAPWRGRAHRND